MLDSKGSILIDRLAKLSNLLQKFIFMMLKSINLLMRALAHLGMNIENSLDIRTLNQTKTFKLHAVVQNEAGTGHYFL